MASPEDEIRGSFIKSLCDDGVDVPTILPWDRFSSWLHCACVVTFDLELGQAMELIYPSHIKLTEKEKTNICYLSFPDSNSGCMGDTQFHFRIRQCPGKRHYVIGHAEYNREAPTALQSVVLISKLPFMALFSHISSVVAPEYFDNGEPSLEAACHDIDQWPFPVPGQTLNLPLMGSVIQARVPCRTDKITGSQYRSPSVPSLPVHTILPTVHEVDMFSAFLTVLPHVQMLWELVITGEPLVVMAASPSICSNTVQALVNTIWPLRYCADYRPYFTIHDTEFKEYTTRTQAPPNVILGVTNPFFAKTLQHWPHVLRIGEMNSDISGKGFNKIKKTGAARVLDSKPGVYTRYKAFLNKDKTILKRLAKGLQTRRPVEVQNAMLRRYLLELTQSFMIPLERYMASLMPLQRNISPHKGAPSLKPFDTEEFVRSLDHSGPQLTSGVKGDWIGLYKKFFRSESFAGWYHQRQQEVNQKLQALHVEALCDADLMQWIRGKQEVEIVDLVLRLREKIKYALDHQIPITKDKLDQLQLHMESIISTLPDDLKLVLNSN